jgi:uncharacterized protein
MMDIVYVKFSPISGNGVFANQNIKKGTLIEDMKGKIVPDNEESHKKYNLNYMCPISKNECLLIKTNGKYINHSCDPNCGIVDSIKIVAIKDIKKDEEISVDYDTIEYEWEMKCNCGSAICRKKIRGYRYLSEELKKKYKDFTSSYLISVNNIKPN